MNSTHPDLQIDLLHLQRIGTFVRETESRITHLQVVLGRMAATGQTVEPAQAAMQALQNALDALTPCKKATERMIDAIDAAD